MTLFVNQSSVIPLPSQLSESTQLSQVSDSNNNDKTTSWTDPKTGLTYDIPMGEYCLDFDGDSICDVDFNDGKMVVYEEDSNDNDNGNDNDNNNNDEDIQYCEGQDAPAYPDSCYDRNDLPEDSGYDDDDKPNCNDVEYGTNCDGSEDEDSWTDDEYYENDNGALGERIE
jgi:hypothetical protein